MNIKIIFFLGLALSLAACGGDPEPEAGHPASDMAQQDAEHKEEHKAEENHKHEDTASHQEEAGHPDGDEHQEEAGTIKLTPEQIEAAGIVVIPLQPKPVARMVTAPGEVKLNAYRTVKIAPRIAGQVIARHARLGDEVEAGQPLVTLSSVEMAAAQGELLVASREWQRVKKLGRKVVSERRYTEARVKHEQALSRVKAYGMTDREIEALLRNRGKKPDGTFQLLAPMAGRVLHDNFIVGERVEPGRELMVIADESVMWVEARISPEVAGHISIGSPAEVLLGKRRLPARVSQIHHALDETTRTLAIRLEVANENDLLHPGMFVTTHIQSQEQSDALVVPEEAVLRSQDGDWQIFIQGDEPGEFRAVEVELLRVDDGQAVISGIKPDTPVVIRGAFFVQSELAKSGFEVHNH